MHRTTTFHRLFVLGLLLLLATLAGCTSAVTTAAPTSGVPTANVVPNAAAVKTTALPLSGIPTSAPTQITILIPEDPKSFNAAIEDQGYDSMVMKMTMLGLTGIDPDGKVYPQLAAELPTQDNGGVQINEATGAMTVTWKLRTDVFWADGAPVTADDVLFTYAAIKDPATGIAIDGLDYVDSVSKIDSHTVAVRFNAIYPSYLTLFGGDQVSIWPWHYCDAAQGFTAWDCNRRPLSDGPYLLQEWAAGDHLTFVRNPHYYQPGKPAIDSIIVRIVPEAAVRKTMLVQGDADVIMWASEQIADELKNEPAVKVSVSSSSRFVMRLFMNLAAKGSTDPAANPNPVFSDVRVRQAVRMAINVDSISKEIFRGYSVPVWTEFFRQPYVCDIPRPKFDPEAAKALLESAGWKDTNGDGIRECDTCTSAPHGTPMKVELSIYSEYGEPLDLTQQLIGEMLKAIGIDASLSSVQGSVMWADYASGGLEQNGNFSLDMYDDGYAGLDPLPFVQKYYASSSAEPDNGWNVGRWKNAEFDALVSQAVTIDEAKRKQVFCQMAQILDKELPQILLFSTINADAYANRLAGVQANINDVVTWNVADWTLAK